MNLKRKVCKLNFQIFLKLLQIFIRNKETRRMLISIKMKKVMETKICFLEITKGL